MAPPSRKPGPCADVLFFGIEVKAAFYGPQPRCIRRLGSRRRVACLETLLPRACGYIARLQGDRAPLVHVLSQIVSDNAESSFGPWLPA